MWGGAGAATTSKKQTCNQGSRSGVQQRGSSMYGVSGLPVREAMSGGAPWWFAFEDNKEVPIPEHKMPGDKGVVIRRYAARLGGVEQTSPSLSILCDKLELGTPAGLRSLSAGDYVDMSLELLGLLPPPPPHHQPRLRAAQPVADRARGPKGARWDRAL